MRWITATDDELKILFLKILLMGIVFIIFATIIFFIISGNLFVCLFVDVGLGIAFFLLAVFFYKRDWLYEHIDLFSSQEGKISYQAMTLLLFPISIAISFGYYGIAFLRAGFYSAIAFSLVIYFPAIFIFLRRNVYSDESRQLLVEDEFGNQYVESVFGYHPVIYCFMAIILFRGPLGVSLHNILLHTQLLTYNVFCFMLYFTVGCLLLSPDIMNKILPFELRT